jgi:hypothetical protein
MRTAIEILVQDLEKLGVHLFDEVQEAIEQAKEIHKAEKAKEYLKGFEDGKQYERLLLKTFKSE